MARRRGPEAWLVLAVALAVVSAPVPAVASPLWPFGCFADAPGYREPASLAEVVQRLALARLAIARDGRVQLRYTEQQLRVQALGGHIPHPRYLARLVYGDPRPEAPMGTVRSTGKLPLWVTTFEQLEPVDSDPEAIARVLGLPYDASASYTLLVIQDLGADAGARPPLICPTLATLTELAARDLASPGFSEALLRRALALDYQPRYRALMAGFYQQGYKEYLPDDVERFVLSSPELAAPEPRGLFLARLRVHVQYGASEQFRGDGVTQLQGAGPRQAGVLELFSLDPAPKPIGAYEARGRLIRVPCRPLAKPAPLQFLDPQAAGGPRGGR